MRRTDATHWFDQTTSALLHFNEEGKFVDESGNGPQKGFKNDDNFSDWLHDYVQAELEKRGLVRRLVPDVEGGAPIYHTAGALNNPEKLLVLICGAGRIHVGLWSVGVCAYHGLNAGSVLPCLDEAQKRGMEVIILNPNHRGSRLLGNEFKSFGMISHTCWVFKHIIMDISKPQNVFIICHSMGGACTCSSINAFPDFFKQHVKAIAMTDACTESLASRDLKDWCFERCVNWVRSKEELNKDIGIDYSKICMMRSAATNDHPLTTYKAFPHIWEFFDAKDK